MSFSKLGLTDPIVNAVVERGYKAPTAIQERAIPVILSGRDVMAAAQTGTGKTACYLLPMLQMLNNHHKLRGKRIRALVLAPTRELVVQVADNIAQYSKHLNLTSMAMYGGTDVDAQKERLIEGVDILVATPGRLLDMAHQRALHFDAVEFLVLDEADRMLDMGFITDINKIIERLPEKRQNLLFSATLHDEVLRLASTAIDNPAEISIAPHNITVAKIDQWLITVDKDKKSALLSHLIQHNQWRQLLVFIGKKHTAAKLVEQLGKRDIKAEAIHSGRSQANREKLLADFKTGDIPVLVATGIAARGLDIEGLPRVLNYDLPFQADDYIHRIGRTGRAGAAGEAISFVSNDDFKNLCAIESRLGKLIERKEIEGFPVKKTVPISILNYVPKSKREKEEKKKKSQSNSNIWKKSKTKPKNKP